MGVVRHCYAIFCIRHLQRVRKITVELYHAVDVGLVHQLIGRMHVVLGGTDEHPFPWIVTGLQFEAVTAARALHLQLEGDAAALRMADFSNYGANVDFAEPGVEVLSTYRDGRYAVLSGTSAAAPHLAGLLLLKGAPLNLRIIGTAIGDPDGIPDPVLGR